MPLAQRTTEVQINKKKQNKIEILSDEDLQHIIAVFCRKSIILQFCF